MPMHFTRIFALGAGETKLRKHKELGGAELWGNSTRHKPPIAFQHSKDPYGFPNQGKITLPERAAPPYFVS